MRFAHLQRVCFIALMRISVHAAKSLYRERFSEEKVVVITDIRI